MQLLPAASDIAVSTAATSGGGVSGANPNVFTPTANDALTNDATIQTSLNLGTGVTLNTAQPFTLDNSLSAGAGLVLLQTGSIQSASYQTITASSVIVSAPAALRLYGNVADNP